MNERKNEHEHEHLHIHHHLDERTEAMLVKVFQHGLAALLRQGDRIMGAIEDLRQDVKDIDTATNTVAAEVAALRAKITSSMSPEAVAEVRAALGGIKVRLETIGKPEDPAGTIPPTEPTPPV